MFVTNVNGERYRVAFQHDRLGTVCLVLAGERPNEKVYSIGKSTIVPPDQPCKAKGRKIALRNALKSTTFDKSTRAQFWKAYQEKQNGIH